MPESSANAETVMAKVFISLPNALELATPLARASVERGVEVHVTGDVADSAASGGCPASPCSTSSDSLEGGGE